MKSEWIQIFKQIEPLDLLWLTKAQRRMSQQTRPLGSLGDLEDFVSRYVAIQKKDRPTIDRKRVMIFAADHGVEVEGVSAYPRNVTKSMVDNFLNQGATINAIARQLEAEVEVIDVGVDAEFEGHPNLIQSKIRRGTHNIKLMAAMSEEELNRALSIGWDQVLSAKEDGIDLIAVGEMGIGNTTAASAVVAACLGLSASKVTGRGTGIDDAGLDRKISVITEAIRFHNKNLIDPFEILRCLGGFEIAAMVGAIMAAVLYRIPIVVDGWIASSAALIANELNSNVSKAIFFGHQSKERGHMIVLESMGAKPILQLTMRLGEASGAALAVNILQSGIKIYNEVATFKQAQVANRVQ